MKGYVRLKEPEEEIFLAEGAGSVPVMGSDTLQYRVWDATGLTMYIPASRLVTIRLGTGQRPDGYEPVSQALPSDN
jgi:predicted flavoprotein YhiN